MAKKRKDIKLIFSEALEKKTTKEQTAYLDKACGNDTNLRKKVEALLKAYDEADDVPEAPIISQSTFDISPLTEGPGTVIGRYKLLQQIGEGGFGVVYMAEQREPIRRRVALKIIKLGMDTKQVIARFEAERQALALMDHPNIAKVLDAGATDTGRPYFVMELVKGIPITEYCDENNLDTQQRLKLFIDVCKAVQHAHQKGIIHRDIKPTNVLITLRDDDSPVPKIIDFGIAKATQRPLTEKTLFTEFRQFVGTPQYMSPEQARMSEFDVDTRSDIYSLGVLLYELLTGATPFDAQMLRQAGYDEMQRIIREEEPDKPSTKLSTLGEALTDVARHRRTEPNSLTKLIRGDLDWIVLKTLEKDRTHRYETANELARDIQRHLADEPVVAGPPSVVYRLRKFVQRNRTSVAVVMSIAAALIIGLALTTVGFIQASHQRDAAKQAREKESVARTQAEKAEKVASEQRELAEERAEEYRHLSYAHGVALADAKYRERNLSSAQTLLESCPPELRGWEWDRLNYVLDEALITLGSGGGACAIAFSPDGKQIASTQNFCLIKIWDAATGTEIRTLKGRHEASIVSLAFSPDGERIISGSMDRTIKIWDADSGKELMTFGDHEVKIASVDLSTDGKRIVSGDYGGTIKVWETSSGKELLTIRTILDDGKYEYVRSVAFSPDSKRIIAGRNSKKVYEWDAATGEKLRTFSQDQCVHIAEYSPDNKLIAMGCSGGMIKIVDIQTDNETVLKQTGGYGERSLITSLAFSPDSKHLVSGGCDRAVRVWDVSTGEELTALVGHEADIDEVTFSPDGKRIASVAYHGKIRIWDPGIKRERTILKGHTATIRDVIFTPDGKRIISASRDKAIKLWDVLHVNEVMTLTGHEDSVWSVAMSPDGRHIVSGSSDKTIRIWDIAIGEQVRKISAHDGVVFSVAFSPDGKRIVAGGGDDKTVKVWDAETGSELMTFPTDSWVGSVAFSPDGKLIVSGGGDDEDGTIKIWDGSTGEELMTLSGHSAPIQSVMFSPNGKRIVSGSYDSTVKLWDAATGDELMTLHGHNSCVETATFSPDGKRIVSVSHDSTAKVWDVTTGAELMTLTMGNGGYGVAFSPDGKTIAGAGDEEIILWESAVPPNGYGLRRTGAAARKVVAELYKETGFYSEVIDKLNADKTLDEPLHKIALQIANARLWEDAEKQKKQTQDPSPKEPVSLED